MNKFSKYTIIPKLVSLNADQNYFNGFYLSSDFNFYHKENTLLNYVVLRNNNIEIPTKYDFRNGYITNYRNNWYYNWQLTKKLHLRFKFDSVNNVFLYNDLFKIIPFGLGRIIPIGRHISDLINFHLFLNGYIPFKGIALNLKNATIGLIAPSYTGKSSLLKKNILLGAKYIAEDNFILKIKEKLVYPTSPTLLHKNILLRILFDSGRYNKKGINYFLNSKNIIKTPQRIDKIILLANNNTEKYIVNDKFTILDFFFLCSPNFFDNILVKSIIFKQKLLGKVIEQFNNISKLDLNYEVKQIHNFKYDKLLR